MDEKYFQKHQNIVQDMIRNNAKYYYDNVPVTYSFYEDDKLEIFATTTGRTISINYNVLQHSLEINDAVTVEYYILHEMRHIFQNEIINDYMKGDEIVIDENIVHAWIKGKDHYINATNEVGNLNPAYFLQDLEMDAYAYAYAVIKHKYKNADVYVPEYNQKYFYELVDGWLVEFDKYN